jgi:signal transduction histidine kinase
VPAIGVSLVSEGVSAPPSRVAGVSVGRPTRSAPRWMVGVLIAGLAGMLGPLATAAPESSNVLVLYSNERSLPAYLEGDRGLYETVRAPADRPAMLFFEDLGAPHVGGPAFDRIATAYLREKYASRPPRVILALQKEALSFLLSHRQELFPQVPVVHAGIDRLLLRSLAPLPADVVGVPVEYGFSPTIDLALRWHPRARHLVIVTGAAEPDRRFEAQLRKDVSAFKDRATTEFLAALPMHAVLRRLGELRDDAVVFTPGMYRDSDGYDLVPQQSVRVMAAASGAPVYGAFSSQIGTGIVGGYMPSFEAMGRQAGSTVSELLAGVEPGALRLPEVTPQTLNVDWRQIRRWGIDKTAIPRNAVVHYKPPTLLQAYPNAVLAAVAVFVVQAGLISWLLVEHRRRRIAESAERTRRLELAHASRLAVAGELTGSIAHEINQPLGAILSNADAADLILESGTDRRDELRRILADIRRDDVRASEVIRRLRTLLARHEVERKPYELNETVCEIDSMLGAEARRRGLTLAVQPAEGPIRVVGDRIEIQQVLINLVLNAMDAVADVPEGRRTVTVSVDSVDGGVDVSVRDRGHGITPENLPMLFEAFFTTKSGGMGLGLSIARTLVEAHGGRVWAENGTGEGAVFHVKLPVASTAGGLSAVHR